MDQQSWDLLVQAYVPPFGAFLQSWEWGEFQRSLGREVIRVQQETDGKIMIAQAIRLPLPFGQSYWFVPKGPLGDLEPQIMRGILRERLKGAAFIRTEGSVVLPGSVKSKDMHPSTTLVLDMHKGCDGLLMEMHMKTRYNIRLGEKKGVTIRRASLDEFETFVDIVKETTERNDFSAHPSSYYKKMLEMLTGECSAFLVFAEAEGQVLAANIMIDFLDTRTYLHGASRGIMRNLKAADVLQFTLINEACLSGKKYYDFWGIAPPEAGEDHPWFGITRFKSGFGGHVIQMPGTCDLPTNPLVYGAYRLSKMLRR